MDNDDGWMDGWLDDRQKWENAYCAKATDATTKNYILINQTEIKNN